MNGSSLPMTDEILKQLDGILDTPYFIPLAPGDALAVQFQVDALKGLTVEDVRAVFNLIEQLEVEPEPDGKIDPDRAAAAFFGGLAEKLPHIHKQWSNAETDMIVNPTGALELAVRRGTELIQTWQDRLTEQAPATNAERESVRRKGMLAALTQSVPSSFRDDVAFREYLRKEILPGFPSWAGPDIYLAAWTEYIKAIFDLDPAPEIRDAWPY